MKYHRRYYHHFCLSSFVIAYGNAHMPLAVHISMYRKAYLYMQLILYVLDAFLPIIWSAESAYIRLFRILGQLLTRASYKIEFLPSRIDRETLGLEMCCVDSRLPQPTKPPPSVYISYTCTYRKEIENCRAFAVASFWIRCRTAIEAHERKIARTWCCVSSPPPSPPSQRRAVLWFGRRKGILLHPSRIKHLLSVTFSLNPLPPIPLSWINSGESPVHLKEKK